MSSVPEDDHRRRSTGGEADPIRCPRCGDVVGPESLPCHLRHDCPEVGQ